MFNFNDRDNLKGVLKRGAPSARSVHIDDDVHTFEEDQDEAAGYASEYATSYHPTQKGAPTVYTEIP